jgi:hypothetical protein
MMGLELLQLIEQVYVKMTTEHLRCNTNMLSRCIVITDAMHELENVKTDDFEGTKRRKKTIQNL